jgi:hypothetical protein
MRNYIYKVLIAVIALIVLFEFTIGKTINKISSQTELVFTKEGRKGMISSIKVEMEKAIKKENYLDEDDTKIINKFIKKIKDELKSAE